MNNISIQTVAEVIILARELANEPARAEVEFDAFIGSMNQDEKAALTALMWVGRGSYEPADFAVAEAAAMAEATTPTASYLKGSPHLAEHLENGLDLLGYSVREAEESLL
ncbi:MAG: DUF3775 domain-containing protein [Rhodobacteraceae bacterium]|nr:DUF3775 domain-containing protein [Paracoccaceae bacterium]